MTLVMLSTLGGANMPEGCYLEEADPGAVGDRILWIVPSTGVAKVRNATNTAWIDITAAAAVAWTAITGKPTTLAGFGITDGATDTELANVRTEISPDFQVLVDAGTVEWDLAEARRSHARVTLGGNRTLDVTNPIEGTTGILFVQQDATGSRTLTLPGTELNGGVELSTTPGAIDSVFFVYDGATFYWFKPGVDGSDPVMGGDLTGTASNAQIGAGAVGAAELATSPKTFAIVFEFGDELTVPTANTRSGGFRLPVACTITRADISSDATGSAVVDVLKAAVPVGGAAPSYSSIAASAKPTLSTAGSAADATLTGWTTAVAAGERLKANLDSVTTCKKVTVTLTCVRS
jgi:hypothetical protein